VRPGLRSLLFVPGSDEARLRKAADRGADAVIVDLEDAVRAQDKDAAREIMTRFLQSRRTDETAVIVRVNAPATPWFLDDWQAVSALDVDAVMVPKADALALRAVPEGPALIALIETAVGVEEAGAVASNDRVARLMLGSADLAADVGSTLRDDEWDMFYARSRVVYASAVAGIEPPIDIVHLALRDEDALRASTERGRDLGFGGKACIHPAQIPVVNAAYTPTDAELRDAEAVVAALRDVERGGVAVLGGRMIDAPVAARALRTLAARREASIR
jgi:citrate lyase beta subunit